MNNAQEWEQSQKMMVILAHPDDPEFSMGGTIAMWTSLGHEVTYCILTRGDKGTDDKNANPDELTITREKEQKAAAAVLGVNTITFLRYPDGYLFPDLEKRKSVVREIRRNKPNIVITSDPTNLFPREGYLNHPDHRAAGQIVLDAVFPAAGNPMYFPELLDEGFEPHSVNEIWLSNTSHPNVVIDTTAYWQKKLYALYEHKSQIGEREKFIQRMLSRRIPDSSLENPRFEEKFFRNVFI
jgi:LmbE family N-acetylglucosaminyl deacetylase